ncbi:hypothetical protein F7U66_00370 [Vibrio parahaemolyticus]|nr:hypothetical protein [Vibrio parahaemolyticus]
MENLSVITVTLQHISSDGTTSSLAMQYVGEGAIDRVEVSSVFLPYQDKGIHPFMFGMRSPGPNFEWQAKEGDSCLCDVISVNLSSSVDASLPIADIDAHMLLKRLAGGPMPILEYQEASTGAMCLHFDEIKEVMPFRIRDQLVVKVGKDGVIDSVTAPRGLNPVLLSIVDEDLERGNYTFADKFSTYFVLSNTDDYSHQLYTFRTSLAENLAEYEGQLLSIRNGMVVLAHSPGTIVYSPTEDLTEELMQMCINDINGLTVSI